MPSFVAAHPKIFTSKLDVSLHTLHSMIHANGEKHQLLSGIELD